MKLTAGILLAVFFLLLVVTGANAQTPESIWLSVSTTSYKTGETVTATVNAASATQIQGFTFQIRYDPACLQPINAASPIPGMNGLYLPQTIGLVDASFASTTPQTVVGVIAEVKFTALAGCQTDLTLESASLAIRDASGFAAPLPGVTLGERNVPLAIDSAVGEPQAEQPLLGTPLALSPETTTDGGIGWGTILLIMVLVFVVAVVITFGVYKFLNR